MSMLEIEFLTATLLLLSLNNSKCQCTSSGISFENARLTEQVIIKRSIETCHLFYKQICFNFWNNKKSMCDKVQLPISKVQKMYKMVILTTGFGEFEFSRTFALVFARQQFWKIQKCPKEGEFQIKIEKKKCQKLRENSNYQSVKKCRKIQIPQILL